jgi:hypothetical protein
MVMSMEQMHERASGQWKPNENTEQMGPMIRPQIDAGDQKKADENQSRWRGQKGPKSSLLLHVI